ncbi:FecR family protein [Parapedobacter indicus]|uniref:FecR family protein n=1 Tax=Parapedobacter indicus TaxID=1477437 RepID=A0A1I3FPV5_9SPHI|nr:FecR family protein [Parapedobacter indicus]PPL03827.1 FecR family protein [Parapedobacter indicus]SFI13194.1 FecR family protein [Parapedobacter indicus]
MNPESERIEELFRLFIDGSLTELQRIELQGYLTKYPELNTLYTELADDDSFLLHEWADFAGFNDTKPTEISGRKTYFSFSSIRLVAGLALFFTVFAAVWLYRSHTDKADYLTRKERYKNDINAGSNKAMVTLADGNLLFLGDASISNKFKQSGAPGVELSEGQITYLPVNKERSAGFNTVRTPEGGQYRVVLPDGSSAKLNAASSIRFPAVFGHKKRVVEIQGEVYFDVVSDKARPFVVNLPNRAQIEVLGTSFNVKAYPDDMFINTTLEKGSVKFKAGEDALLIKSGEQIQLTTQVSNPVLLKRRVGLNTETSWKDGYFNFENAELKTIMKEVARWYDVDVEYKTQITEQFSILMLPRSFSISRLLELLELTGHVKFIIDGRRITVMT